MVLACRCADVQILGSLLKQLECLKRILKIGSGRVFSKVLSSKINAQLVLLAHALVAHKRGIDLFCMRINRRTFDVF